MTTDKGERTAGINLTGIQVGLKFDAIFPYSKKTYTNTDHVSSVINLGKYIHVRGACTAEFAREASLMLEAMKGGARNQDITVQRGKMLMRPAAETRDRQTKTVSISQVSVVSWALSSQSV